MQEKQHVSGAERFSQMEVREVEVASTWRVQERYAVRRYKTSVWSGEILEARGKVVKEYRPADEPNLWNHLADVSTKRLEPEQFAAKYGLLGYDNLSQWDVNKVLGNDRLFLEVEGDKPPGDPIIWFMWHAKTVHQARELIQLLDPDADPQELRTYVERLWRDWYPVGGWPRKRALLAELGVKPKPAALAHAMLREMINPNLEGIHRQLYPDPLGRSRGLFTFRALIEMVYYHLANLLEGKGFLNRCEGCGKPFYSRDRRPKHCPPPPGVSISRCASLKNVRVFREKKKLGNKGPRGRKR